MTILSTLNSAYERMAARGEVPPIGYSYQKIGFLVAINDTGRPLSVTDWRTGDGKKKTARSVMVPQPAKRTSGIIPNFLWDKTSYVLGVTAGSGKRTQEEHAAFLERHEDVLGGADDVGLLAFLRFLRNWRPESFEALAWPEEMKDQNIAFTLESDRLENVCIHDRPAAKALWAQLGSQGDRTEAICLVSGEKAPVARLHPAIKGVWGAQSSGASIVSFNLDAFESYGHEQGDNAPVSEEVAFAYTTVLNKFLERDSGHRIQIGDASVVFWADGSRAEDAEGVFAAMFGQDFASRDRIDESAEARKIDSILSAIRSGKLTDFDPGLASGVRFHILGLAPNAARLSIRFWLDDNFGRLAEEFKRFLDDMAIEPVPEQRVPLWRYLREIAVLRKSENVPPNLAGEWLRAILTGANYPLTLLATSLMRIRTDKTVNGLRAAMLRAVLVRNFNMEKEAPVALDLDNRNKGYLLGRLFAAYEYVQSAALGRNVNATIKDKFYGSASAQPRRVFARLESSSANHLAKVGKQRPGQRVNLEKLIGGIMDLMDPNEDPFPASLTAREQALFGLGYYHQRSEFFKSKTSTETDIEEAAQ